MASHPSLIESPSDREIVSSRVFDVPRELVWAACTDPQHVVQWWGPKGFTNTIHEMDVRPGGLWRLTMHGADGTDYHNKSEFTEVVRPERIVYQHLEPVHRFQMSMRFAERNGKTELTWRMLFEAVSECAPIRFFITEANERNFDRLAAFLAKAP